jgi:hypothetical protein
MFDRPSYNHIQDSTGSNGALPDAEYDINCPALGMPDFKLNYLASSCEIRLASKVKRSSCNFGDGCPRFRSKELEKVEKVAKVIKPKLVEKRIKMPKIARENHKCLCCGEIGTYKSRGLIQGCYDKHRFTKTLDQFPLTRKRAKT